MSTAKRKYSIFLLFLIIAGAVACGVILDVNPTELVFHSKASSEKSFNVISNTDWTAHCDADWCSVLPSSGTGEQTLTVRVAQNDSLDARFATITITASNNLLSKTVAITQTQAPSPSAIPVIHSFNPTSAGFGSVLSIQGANFSPVLSENNVTLNGVPAVVLSASETEIRVEVPKNKLCSGLVQVTTSLDTATSNTHFTYVLTATVSTLAGNGTSGNSNGNSTEAQFRRPEAISMDTDNNIYVADTGNSLIRKITPEGVVSTFAGSTQGSADGIATLAQFHFPHGIATDLENNLYVSDSQNHRIRKITPTGIVTTLSGTTRGFADGPATHAQWYTPRGLNTDSQGNLYVADVDNNCIRKVAPNGFVSTLIGGFGVAAPFDFPYDVDVDAQGNLYVLDTINHRISKVTPTRNILTIAGGTAGFADGEGSHAQFNYPMGLAVDAKGTLYVADRFNHRIRMVTPEGVVSTLAGSGPIGYGNGDFADGTGDVARFFNPTGIVVDAEGNNLYVADNYNHRIRKITLE
ncbi:MAG: IPT/TIG domain-containing protein [Proteobacteria bacterium]|nr:IPT/TIG domain-containing protein [Cystobacterineae bacterium]MCL2258220.1 IPT/TIG domain-containing protein [Cystobacterineae bacterium]MCL2315436.1 IPT/TIG domain-containing protein [Pseudomonadota bacterium]